MDLVREFEGSFGRRPQCGVRAPGRVNLLGEHVDYNDGLVLPVAIDREVRIAAIPREDRLVQLVALDLGEAVEFSLDELPAKRASDGTPLPRWAFYPAGVAWALQSAAVPLVGLQAAYSSTVPIGSGLSSSAAVEVGFARLWQLCGGWEMDALDLARHCQTAENGYVGVACGLMDQFASACGVAGHALLFDTRSLEWRPVPLLPGVALVIADSGIRRSLATSAYNDRRQDCEQAVAILRQYIPGLQSLRDLSTPEFAAYSDYLPPLVRQRAEHVVKEIARVVSAVNALERQDAQSFGALMIAGHHSLRDLYQVSLPELDILVEIAHQLPGCIGARLTGAGFGGCTVNLVEIAQVSEFCTELGGAYQQRTGNQAQIYVCQASQGASELSF